MQRLILIWAAAGGGVYDESMLLLDGVDQKTLDRVMVVWW
jgi:hypothetical protein